jgi:hypothetical protein
MTGRYPIFCNSGLPMQLCQKRLARSTPEYFSCIFSEILVWSKADDIPRL